MNIDLEGIVPTGDAASEDTTELNESTHFLPNSELSFDVQPAVWLTDYALTLVGLALVTHLLTQTDTITGPTVALTVYYFCFALGWCAGGLTHHLSYRAIKLLKKRKQSGEDSEDLAAALARLNLGIEMSWQAASALNVAGAAASLVVFFWLTLEEEAAEVASVVAGVLGGALAVFVLVKRGVEFKYFLPLPVVALVCFGVGCAIVQVYEGLGYAVLSICVVVQQQARWQLSEKYFNHNAVFHTIILFVGYPLLHLAALKLVKISF